MSRWEKRVLGVYGAWAVFTVAVTLMREGLGPNNVTRLLIIAFLAAGLAWYRMTRARVESSRRPGLRFVVRCSAAALVVEGCYMFSRPVFPSLTFTPEMPLGTRVANTAIDFAFTFPAYLVIFSVVWWLVTRYRYRVVEYVLLMSLGQALGDGNAAFIANPVLLLFAPYVMLNYQAINIVPFLRARPVLSPTRRATAARFILPLLLLPAIYWVMGAAIIVAGRPFGLSAP
jgi:hypothetical protein